MHKTYNGKEFNALCKQKTLIKLTNKWCSHRGYTYKDGLNVDRYKLSPQHKRGGFCFANMDNISIWLAYYFYEMKYCWDVVIPSDATVIVYDNYYKTDKFVISNKRKISDLDCWNNKKFCENSIKQNPYSIKYANIQTHDMCMIAVQHRGYLLKYIKHQEYDICLAAVKENGLAIEYVENIFKDQRLCIEATKQCGFALKFIPKDKQTERVCVSAVQNAVMAFTYVDSAYRNACRPGIRNNNLEYKYGSCVDNKYKIFFNNQKVKQ